MEGFKSHAAVSNSHSQHPNWNKPGFLYRSACFFFMEFSQGGSCAVENPDTPQLLKRIFRFFRIFFSMCVFFERLAQKRRNILRDLSKPPVFFFRKFSEILIYKIRANEFRCCNPISRSSCLDKSLPPFFSPYFFFIFLERNTPTTQIHNTHNTVQNNVVSLISEFICNQSHLLHNATNFVMGWLDTAHTIGKNAREGGERGPTLVSFHVWEEG